MAKNTRKHRNICQLRNLLLVALADGSLTEKEEQFLRSKAKEYKISEKVYNRVCENTEKIYNTFPKDLGQKLSMLYELAEMVIVDNIIRPEEVELCRSIAIRMGVFPGSVEQIFKDLERSGKILRAA